jgi:urease accessory protein
MNFHMKNVLLAMIACTGSLFSGLTLAHPGHDVSISFISGLLHPFSGLDHLLVIVLIGFWSAFVLKKIWLGPCIFVFGMCLGVIAGLASLPLSFFEFGIAASVIVLGFLLLVRNWFSNTAILALIGSFGVFHGFAHADQLTSSSIGLLLLVQDLVGLILATGVLHLSGAFLVKVMKEKTSIFAKVAGISSLAYGLFLMGQLVLATVGGAST